MVLGFPGKGIAVKRRNNAIKPLQVKHSGRFFFSDFSKLTAEAGSRAPTGFAARIKPAVVFARFLR
jgi:hypothetical protein